MMPPVCVSALRLLCIGAWAATCTATSNVVFEGAGSGISWIAAPDEPASAPVYLERDGADPRLRVKDADLSVDGECSCESLAVRAPVLDAGSESLCGAPGFSATWTGADLLSMLESGAAQTFANRTFTLVGDGTELSVPRSGTPGTSFPSVVFWQTSLGPARRSAFELTVDVDFQGVSADADFMVGVAHDGRARNVVLFDSTNHPLVARPYSSVQAGPNGVELVESPYGNTVSPSGGLRGASPPYRVSMDSSRARFAVRVRDGLRWEAEVGSLDPLVLAGQDADPAAPTEPLKLVLTAPELHEAYTIQSVRVQLRWKCDAPPVQPHSLPESRFRRRWSGAELVAMVADGSAKAVGPRNVTVADDGASAHFSSHQVAAHTNDVVLRIPLGFLPPRARVQFKTNLTRLSADCDVIVGLANGVNTTYLIDHDRTNVAAATGFASAPDFRHGADNWNTTTARVWSGLVGFPTPEAYPLTFSVEIGANFARSVAYNRLGEVAHHFIPEAGLETADRPVDLIIGLNDAHEEANIHWVEYAMLPPLDLPQSG